MISGKINGLKLNQVCHVRGARALDTVDAGKNEKEAGVAVDCDMIRQIH